MECGGSDAEMAMGVIVARHYFQAQTGVVAERKDFVSWDIDMYDAEQALLTNSQVRRSDVWHAASARPALAGSHAHDRCRGKSIAHNHAL